MDDIGNLKKFQENNKLSKSPESILRGPEIFMNETCLPFAAAAASSSSFASPAGKKKFKFHQNP